MQNLVSNENFLPVRYAEIISQLVKITLFVSLVDTCVFLYVHLLPSIFIARGKRGRTTFFQANLPNLNIGKTPNSKLIGHLNDGSFSNCIGLLSRLDQ